MNNNETISLERQEIIRRAIRMEICMYLMCFISYTIIFAMIILINYQHTIIGLGSLLCIYISTSTILSFVIYYKAKLRYRALYLTLSWNQRITPNEVANVLNRKHNINNEEILEFDEENNVITICFCMEEKPNAECVKLDCNHIFHTECLAEWLIHNNSCPNCRVTNIINRADFE